MVKLLFIDNLDSFTYNLVDYFSQEGVECIVMRNNVSFDKIIEHKYDGLIISPGPGLPSNAGILMEIVEYYHNKIPILGICLGHQAIGEYFGAKLQKAKSPMHGKKSIILCKEDSLFQNLPTAFTIVRYHSIVVTELPETLIELAVSKDGELMVMKHSNLPIYGIQYHPEAIQTEYGKEIVRNWIHLLKIAA